MLNKISPFGPSIGIGTISNSLNSILLEIIKDDNLSSASNKLISYVHHEKTITDELHDCEAGNLISEYIIDYINNCEPGIYKPLFPLPRSSITLQNAWVNIQKQHEFHPIHTHHGSDVVCVIYPKVNIKNSSPYDSRKDVNRKPGSLVLNYGHLLNYGVGQSEFVHEPKECDIIIFPGDLNHYTLPIFGDDERVSISCNFAFNENTKRKLSEYIKRTFY